MGRPMDALDRFLIRPGVAEGERSFLQKRFFFIMVVMGFVVTAACTINAKWDEELRAVNVAFPMGVVLTGASAAWVGVTKTSPRCLVRFLLVAFTIPILLIDLHLLSAMQGFRCWSGVLLLLDVALVMDEGRVTQVILLTTTIWLLAVGVEQASRVGLYELFPNSADRACSCPNPPCAQAISNSVLQCASSCTILFLNFYLTHGFSAALVREQEKIAVAVKVAEDVATALAHFNLQTASSALEEAEALPVQLSQAFAMLLANLEEYRPYLPQSCLPIGSEEEGEVEDEDGGSSGASEVSSLCKQVSDVNGRRESGTMHSRPVSILVTNLHKFLAAPEEVVVRRQNDLVAHAVDRVRSKQGIMHWFNGDYVVAVFNGSRKCMSHARNAAMCAYSMHTEWGGSELTVAVATGSALLGPIGCHESRAYGVIGRVFCWANGLVRVATWWKLTVACDGKTQRDLGGCAHARLLRDNVSYIRTGEIYDVYEITGTQDAMAASLYEWMYELQEAIDADPWSSYNKAIQLARQGEVAQGREVLLSKKPLGWEKLESELSQTATVIVNDCCVSGTIAPPQGALDTRSTSQKLSQNMTPSKDEVF